MSRRLSRAVRPEPRRRRWPLRAALGVGLALAVTLGLAVETRPRAAGAPDGAAAREAVAAGETLRAFVAGGAAQSEIALGAGEIDALLMTAGRLAPGAAAAARLAPGPAPVSLALSVGPPALPAPVWANLTLDFAAGPGGLEVTRARLGRLPLPPSLVEAAMARGLDAALDAPGLTRTAMGGVVGLRVEGETLRVAFEQDPATRAAVLAELRALLNLGGGGGETGPVHAHLWWLNRSGDEGALPAEGSALPYLRHAVERSGDMGRRWRDTPDRERMAAALLALALYCGEAALGPAVGVTLKPHMRGANNHCEGTTLGGRDDLKRHFVVSAGLYAASTGPVAFGVGEVKELVDSGEGGTGFSFDDMAANVAGARFAAAFLGAPRAEWPAMLELVQAETDVLPDVSDLPRGLDEAAFRARFGDVDSPAYRAMIAEIERRVNALPFHRALARG